MTTPTGTGPASTSFSREMTATRACAEVEKGRTLPPARGRAAAAPTFAACLDLLAREGRGGRTPAANLAMRADRLPGAAEEDTARHPDPSLRASDTRGELDGRGDGVLSASDDVAVGREATIDPMVQVLVGVAPRCSPASAPTRPDVAAPDARTPIEQLMAKLVRRIAWSGNARTGLARLELGAGELEGATLTIHAEDGVVRVALDLPPGVDSAAWKERISERLGARGLQVEAVDVA